MTYPILQPFSQLELRLKSLDLMEEYLQKGRRGRSTREIYYNGVDEDDLLTDPKQLCQTVEIRYACPPDAMEMEESPEWSTDPFSGVGEMEPSAYEGDPETIDYQQLDEEIELAESDGRLLTALVAKMRRKTLHYLQHKRRPFTPLRERVEAKSMMAREGIKKDEDVAKKEKEEEDSVSSKWEDEWDEDELKDEGDGYAS